MKPLPVAWTRREVHFDAKNLQLKSREKEQVRTQTPPLTTTEQSFPWGAVNLGDFKRLKNECPELFALAGKVNVLSDLLDRYTTLGDPELNTGKKVQGQTRQLTTLLSEVNCLFQTLNT